MSNGLKLDAVTPPINAPSLLLVGGWGCIPVESIPREIFVAGRNNLTNTGRRGRDIKFPLSDPRVII